MSASTRAVGMAMAMCGAASEVIAVWRRHGYHLGLGAGTALGYAILGQIGSSERSGCTAIGTVCNLAARLMRGERSVAAALTAAVMEAQEWVADNPEAAGAVFAS